MRHDITEISAHSHSGHPNEGTIETYRHATGTGADYIELDVRRTADGELVAFHDRCTRQGQPLSAMSYPRLCDLAGYEVPRVVDVLTAINDGRAKAHLDLKEVGREADVVQLALEILGPGQFVVTTLEDISVSAIRSVPRFKDVPVALSLGRDMKHATRATWLRIRRSELRPVPRLQECGARWVAVDHRLALAGVLRQCRQHHLKVMVWTVNNPWEMRYWLAGHRADVLITDRPGLAVALRDRAGACRVRDR